MFLKDLFASKDFIIAELIGNNTVMIPLHCISLQWWIIALLCRFYQSVSEWFEKRIFLNGFKIVFKTHLKPFRKKGFRKLD